jgi:hypothetical protein
MPAGVDLAALFSDQKWQHGDELDVTLRDEDPVKKDEQGKTYRVKFESYLPDQGMIHGRGNHPEYGDDCVFGFHDYVIEKVERA